ncbi:GNAT family N-acetyltransferase [Rhodoblastus sp.]|uniref:GNAT family N-acetyltransferase n=2 Tax=Rhodoblastus sp. TaxID=1962975 RepID=UPI003F9D1047
MSEPESKTIDAPWRLIRLGPRDGDRYCDHLMRLDSEDRRFRFFEEPEEFLMALHAGAAVADGRIVVGCESEGQIRGVGELLADAQDPRRGELAFSVERDWRRRGLGRALMQAMIDAARDKSFRCLELEILPDNLAMQNLARRFTSDLQRRNGNVIATIGACVTKSRV